MVVRGSTLDRPCLRRPPASIVESLAGAPIMVVVTYREGHQPLWLRRSYVTRWGWRRSRPETADARSCRSLARRPRRRGPARHDPWPARRKPFFWRSSRIRFGAGRPGGVAAVPGTVHEVLLKRLDRASPRVGAGAAQAASVIGRDFSPRSCAPWRVARRGSDARLAALVQAEFLYEAVVADDPLYAFRHALTTTSPTSLAPARRRELHAAAARAPERRFADRIDDALRPDRLPLRRQRSPRAGRAHICRARTRARLSATPMWRRSPSSTRRWSMPSGSRATSAATAR